MKNLKLLVIALISITTITGNAQIIVDSSTLPEVGDSLVYGNLGLINDSVHEETGSNHSWDFSNLSTGIGSTSETYNTVIGNPDASAFPDADIVVSFFGMQGFAKINNNNIEVIGVVGNNLGLPFTAQLSEPFIIKRAPMYFEDSFNEESSLTVSVAIDMIPGLGDLIEASNPIPGSSIDSIRIGTNMSRTEIVNSWGNVSFNGTNTDVLKLTQTDEMSISIEAYANTFLLDFWVDVSAMIPGDMLSMAGNTTITNKFLDATSKESILSFSENSLLPTVTGQYKYSLVNNVESIESQEWKLYPNPSTEFCFIDDIQINSNVKLIDITGKEVWSKIADFQTMMIYTKEFNSGIYFVNIEQRNGIVKTKKLVIQ